MKDATVFIPGRPVPYTRSDSNGKRRFLPERYRRWRTTAAWFLNRLPKLDPPLELEVVAVYSYGTRSALAGKPMRQRPDADNIAKGVMDAGNGGPWPDDCEITDLVSRKRYIADGETPGVFVTVKEAR